ncbi:MAG: DUF3078 domain-containing protein [Muribaculaceae bacterium]|nr:DUF3078 domain-containing protein [Muribaculaceae bacterium]
MNRQILKTFSSIALALAFAFGASAQDAYTARSIEELDAFLAADTTATDTLVVMRQLPAQFFGPAVYSEYYQPDTASVFTPDFSGNTALRWLEEENALNRSMNRIRRALFFEHPEAVKYNINMLPEAPKKFHAVVNPEDHTIEITEFNEVPTAPTVEAAPIKKKHWIRVFDASLQFSQAFVSPNWYQGGNNNLNMLANVLYNVKLNQEYHPKLLFESTFQYKLGMNNAPDDEVHDYSISDDLFQITSTFGLKAAKRWYYSLTGLFKTQLLNSYASNSTNLRSAFLSSGELTIGLGMTYNYANAKKTVSFDASIAPLSYNMKTCINKHIDPKVYGIDNGKRIIHNFGSSAEIKFAWQIAYNISYTSRVFAFSDYDDIQVDWENKVAFTINRFLSTQIQCHARYDSGTPKCADEKWKKLQIKEILSIGFSYKFSTL